MSKAESVPKPLRWLLLMLTFISHQSTVTRNHHVTSTWNDAYSSSLPGISGLYFQPLLPSIWKHTSNECE